MIQIRKLREFIPKGQTAPKKYDAPLTPDIVFNTIEDLLSSINDTVNNIPESERYNLFCTLHNVPDTPEGRKEKAWGTQELIMFDIDGIPHNRDDKLDEAYLEVLADAINVQKESILQILSGGGYHFVVRLKNPIKDIDFFDKNRIYYQVLCSRINDRLRDKGLQGVADAAVFAPNRMFRLPLTLNIKPDRPKVWVKLLHSHLEAIDLDLQKASGLPLLTEKDFISERELSYLRVDTSSVEDECEYLKWAKENQQEMSEPQWYAMLSIVARLEGGKEKVHDYSKYHPSYNETVTNRKAEQSLGASGPRTCDNINSMWKGCSKCVHYKKLRSPIAIKGQDFIATAHSGFHALNAKGSLTPQYDDLKKFYNKNKPYLNVNNVHYQYTENHWQELSDVYIDNFAEEYFYPKAKNTMANEFRGKVKRTNLQNPEWFRKSTNRRLNLANGVLNIDTMELEPHDKKFGFKAILDFNYDKEANAPTFTTMLDGVTCGDKTLQANLLEYMGYCLSNDDPRADKILVCTGEGQNGKSRFLNILRALGGDAVTSLGVRDLQNAFHLQALDGALFNILEEVPSFTEKDVWELIKGLVTGAAVTASRKFKDPYSFCNKAKFIMTCNELPKGANPNHGFFRRLLIVPFNAKFSHELGNIDVNIDQRVIENELPGVLNLVLNAYHALREREYQFTDSRAVRDALIEYKEDMDSVARWVADHIEVGEPINNDTGSAPDWMTKDKDGNPCADVEEMFTSYAKRCKDLEERPVAFRTFSKRLYGVLGAREVMGQKDKVMGHKRTRINGVKRRVLYGVTWHDESAW